MKNHIVFCSAGKASLAVADHIQLLHPEDNILLYFTDTLWENEDAYRFINEASDKMKLPLLTHSTGLNPIQLMFEKKMVYNNRIGDCSKLLKQRVASDFLKKGIRPALEHWRNRKYLKNEDFITDATLYFGIGFDEMHRQDAIIENWKPFKVEMPLIENNIWKEDVLKRYDIKQPILYDLGFTHNNCNARCVKAGQAHYKLLKDRMPDVFQKIMEQEYHLRMCVSAYRYIKDTESDGRDGFTEEVREMLYQEIDDAYRDYFYDRAPKPKLYIHPAAGATCEHMKIKPYSFMKKQAKQAVKESYTDDDGKRHTFLTYPNVPYTIRELHMEIENDQQIDLFDIGGCGCFVDVG